MSFRFRMTSQTARILTTTRSSEPNWSPGDVVDAGGRPAYRITAATRSAADNDVYAGIRAVEPIGAT